MAFDIGYGQIWAVDFDGTLCEYDWPAIGEPHLGTIQMLIHLKKTMGVKLILWTCRSGDELKEAVEWCKQFGLEFDAVNENLPEIIAEFGKDTRKIFAHVYYDDSALRP